MNSTSSRSHLLLALTVLAVDKVTGDTTTGKLTLADLAGSERVSKSGTSGDRLTEANAINKSLSALGQVFLALQRGDKHVPYRNSKLTQALQDSLGGDAKTCVFVALSPDRTDVEETLTTAAFADQIKGIRLKPCCRQTALAARSSKRSATGGR